MSAALGLGKSKTNSQSTQESFGTSASQSADISRSTSQSTSGGSTTQNIAFEDLYRQLFTGAVGAGNAAVAEAPELATAARQLFTGGTQFMEGLGNDAGSSYLEDRLSSDNPVLEEQISALREDTGRLFSEQLNPAITSRAVAGGTLGGGRQGVAQGLAIDAAAREFTRGATALRSEDIGRRDAAATAVMQGSLQSASTGLGALPGLLDLVDRGVNSELGIYGQVSSILGGPTVLSQSQQFSQSTAQSAAEAFSRSFGQQTSTGQSTSRGRAWNFDTSASFGGMGGG